MILRWMVVDEAKKCPLHRVLPSRPTGKKDTASESNFICFTSQVSPVLNERFMAPGIMWVIEVFLVGLGRSRIMSLMMGAKSHQMRSDDRIVIYCGNGEEDDGNSNSDSNSNPQFLIVWHPRRVYKSLVFLLVLTYTDAWLTPPHHHQSRSMRQVERG